MAAVPKRQIGFVINENEKNDEKQNRKLETGNRKPPSEGPMIGLLKINLNPQLFKSLESIKFLRLRIKSEDGKFGLDLILKDSESVLELVPHRIPAISLIMASEEFEKDMQALTIVHIEDGLGKHRGFKIAAIKSVEMLNDEKGPRKKEFLN